MKNSKKKKGKDLARKWTVEINGYFSCEELVVYTCMGRL